MTKINNIWLRLTVGMLLAVFALTAKAQDETPDMTQQDNATATSTQVADPLDSVEISLITCEPHHLIYALYGHTGIRINDLAHGQDVIANWGIFDQSQSFFIVRFTFGLTDYRMAIEPWAEFCARYSYFNCGIREQVLNLTASEKAKILKAISTNSLPENVFYRYNFFYDNCTTRARDIIVDNLDGKIDYSIDPAVTTSYREEIHQWNSNHLWDRWGNDFLLGVEADMKTDRNQQQFLPDTLRVDFDKAVIVENGQRRKLVKEEHWATPQQYVPGGDGMMDYLTRPLCVAILIALLTIGIELIEKRKLKHRLWQWDALLLLLSGIPGIILLAMIFSQHPTVRVNFQILIFNPLALFFMWTIIKKLRQGKQSRLLTVLSVCAGLAVVLSIWQEYAEGVFLLALVLCGRFCPRIHKKVNEKE